MYPTLYFDSIDSTNIKAKEIAENGAVSGAAVVAEFQTKGRGRLGKNWHSVQGKGLYCSIVVRPKNIVLEDYPQITLIAGLSVALVLDRLIDRDTKLKWPNDIYLSGKKIAGILTESSALSGSFQQRYAVIGIGINVNNVESDFPVELRETVTSLSIATGRCFAVRELFNAIRLELLHQLEIFSDSGFQQQLAEWRKKDFLFGKEMECVNTEGKRILGIAQGPDDQGQLHVCDISGKMHEVLSGDVRLASF